MNAVAIILIFSIFLTSVIFCYIPALITRAKVIKKVYPYVTITAAGFLLSIMLNDFIPHLVHGCHGNHSHHHHHDHSSFISNGLTNLKHQIGLIIGGLTFIFLLGLDYLVLHHHHCETEQLEKHRHDEHNEEKVGTCNIDALLYTNSKTEAIIFILSLSLHSFFEGLAFKPSKGISSLEIGIIIHKLLESLTLGFLLHTSQFTKSFTAVLIFVYSLLTPLGISISSFVTISTIIRSIFDGMAFGSIMFIVCVEMLPPSFHSQDKRSMAKVITLFLGYTTTALVLVFTHKH
ncbi:ZIP Zinc transporter [Spraguea lophii 42_110]|uniref:ZIP Zinc transporter n=1 Tax=Spraguea lophii (strain 42_110) TaxID=1358809 RepID=S7W6Z6_SPRLO|nr:ZIP Zinc transporter [Spraguea lophii 42_110]